MIIQDPNGFGKLEVSTVPLPENVNVLSATYTFSGKVLVSFTTGEDPQDAKDFYNLAIVEDDGAGFRTIFSGVIPQHPKANGIRFMPFPDNKRVLLGDYVLECEPDIDSCVQASVIPVRYPWGYEDDPRTTHHWSEIIIAPDNAHISWTILRMDVGAANGLGVLKRQADGYVIEQAQIISSKAFMKADPANPGYLLPQVMRGGEVKQFVQGGAAISLVGAKDGAVADSVVQDLASGDVTQITRTPGYDETTIFSPDERLGLVMSSRGSKKTDPAVLGLIQRPRLGPATTGLTMHLYMYAVAGVRSFRQGNVGPVLIDIQRSMHEPGYQGVVLSDPEEQWVYYSPMSWHPGGTKAMWMEGLRGRSEKRIRFVTLHDYHPAAPVPPQPTPDEIWYGIGGDQAAAALQHSPETNVTGKIAGRHSGCIEYTRLGQPPAPAHMGSIQTTYINFSDDGQTFYNGQEKSQFGFAGESVYEADLVMSGAQHGEMKLRMTFSPISFTQPPRLLFGLAEDGKPKSYGYAAFEGVTLRVDDLSE